MQEHDETRGLERGYDAMRRLTPLSALAALLLSFCASAEPAKVISLNAENDAFLDTDRYYTNGVRLEFAREVTDPNPLASFLTRRILDADASDDILESFALGHTIFTPEDITTPDPLPDQRPYAGFLFADYTLNAQDETGIDWLLIQVGLIGPSAMGEDIQNYWHREVIDREEAQGWDNQLSDELGFVVAYDRQFAPYKLIGDDGSGIDLGFHTGFAVGTIHTDARAGATLRAGSGLDVDYGPPRIKPALGGSGFFNEADGFKLYGFVGAEVRAVAHDIFLDGSLFRGGEPSVDRNPIVADAQMGLVAHYHDLQFAFTYVYRTEEFDGQSGAQKFTAFGVSKRF